MEEYYSVFNQKKDIEINYKKENVYDNYKVKKYKQNLFNKTNIRKSKAYDFQNANIKNNVNTKINYLIEKNYNTTNNNNNDNIEYTKEIKLLIWLIRN